MGDVLAFQPASGPFKDGGNAATAQTVFIVTADAEGHYIRVYIISAASLLPTLPKAVVLGPASVVKCPEIHQSLFHVIVFWISKEPVLDLIMKR